MPSPSRSQAATASRSGSLLGVRAERAGAVGQLALAVALEEDRLAVGGQADHVGPAVEVEIDRLGLLERRRVGRARS